MKSYAAILLLLCLFSVGFSCKKKPKYYAISDQRLRDGVNIKNGSYFIYRDSITNELDSFGVRDYQHFDQYNEGNNETYETMGFNYSISGLGMFSGGGRTTNTIWDNVQFSDGMWTYIIFVKLPFVENETITESKFTYHYLKYYPTYLLNGVSYGDVYEVQTDYGNNYFHSFYSLQSGLIKYTIKTDSYYYVRSLEKSLIIR